MNNKILITGGSGYCGSMLVPLLLQNNYEVVVYDNMIFGDKHLPKLNDNLTIVRGDIRDISMFSSSLDGVNTVIHLACISNDASFELDEKLSTSVNYDCFENLVKASKSKGVNRFIYASSSSVYGISDKPNVTEDHDLVPLTLYNKFKGMCEPILQKHTSNDFVGIIFRPATVCGYAPRLRLDVSVNILTNLALSNNKITVFGGDQLRPNLHVKDYCNAVLLFLEAEAKKVNNEIFNVGFENMSILNIAKLVKTEVDAYFPEKSPVEITKTTSDDNRSYHINSDKIFKVLGFKPKYSVREAIRGLIQAFGKGKVFDSITDDYYYNIRTVKKRKLI